MGDPASGGEWGIAIGNFTQCAKTMRMNLPSNPVSETFCRFSAQMSGGNLLLRPPKIPMSEGNLHERRFTSCVFVGRSNRE
jgi:hypothetical protein